MREQLSGSNYTPTDAEVLAKAIKFAALMLAVGMVALGLMIWQPWSEPEIKTVPYGKTSDYRRCIVYQGQMDCKGL